MFELCHFQHHLVEEPTAVREILDNAYALFEELKRDEPTQSQDPRRRIIDGSSVRDGGLRCQGECHVILKLPHGIRGFWREA